PMTSGGKVNRRALPKPEVDVSERGGYVAPRTPTEEVLAKIWAEALGLERVGIHDNFFELGGDSILSLRIVAAANNAGLQLSPKHFFQYHTIAELGSVAGATVSPVAEQGVITGVVPLTPIQRWFFEQRFNDRHQFIHSLLLEPR